MRCAVNYPNMASWRRKGQRTWRLSLRRSTIFRHFRCSLDFAGDEMTFLVEMVVDLKAMTVGHSASAAERLCLFSGANIRLNHVRATIPSGVLGVEDRDRGPRRRLSI